MNESTPRISAATLARRLGLRPRWSRVRLIGSWPTESAAQCWTGDWPSPPACPASATWPPGCRCPAPPWLRPTPCCGTRAGSTPDAVPGSRLRLPGVPRGSAQVAQGLGPAGLFGYPAMTGDDTIDLSTASLPAPVEALQRAGLLALQDLPDYAVGDGYAPFGLPVLASRRSPITTRRRACRPRRSRSWSPAAHSTPSSLRCRNSQPRATG